MVNQSMSEHDLIIVPFDAMATFEAASFEDLTAVFTSDKYHRYRQPQQQRLPTADDYDSQHNLQCRWLR